MRIRRSALRSKLVALVRGAAAHDALRDWRLAEPGRGLRKACHIQTAIIDTRHLSGMVLECGVGAGGSLALFAHMMRLEDDSRRIVGVDSFEGFPPGTEHDSPNFSPDAKSVYRLFTGELVQANLRRTGLTHQETATVELVKGWIPGVLDRVEGEISILHLDVDLYEPYRDALVLLWPRVQTGGIVLLDEYDRGQDIEKWPGAKKAIDEFCAGQGITVRKHWSGFAYLVKA